MRFKKNLLLASALGATMLWASSAAAQATRTWVSGVGDDVNPCSRTAPCKTFAGAISKTAAGGEINCLDPAGYGTLTITKSITVDCTGTFGSVLNSGGINGFVINDSATTPGTIEVRLRGLSFNGAGTTPGLNGIRFVSGKSLIVEDVFIQNQDGGAGISLQPTGPIQVTLNNVTVSDSSMGIQIQPTGNGLVKALIRNTRVHGSSSNGLRVDTTGSTNLIGTAVTVTDSSFASGASGILVNSTTRIAVLSVNDSTVVNNTGIGISATGGNSTILVGDTTIVGNGVGVAISSGAAMWTYGDNRNDANPNFDVPSNGNFLAPVLPKR